MVTRMRCRSSDGRRVQDARDEPQHDPQGNPVVEDAYTPDRMWPLSGAPPTPSTLMMTATFTSTNAARQRHATKRIPSG